MSARGEAEGGHECEGRYTAYHVTACDIRLVAQVTSSCMVERQTEDLVCTDRLVTPLLTRHGNSSLVYMHVTGMISQPPGFTVYTVIVAFPALCELEDESQLYSHTAAMLNHHCHQMIDCT